MTKEIIVSSRVRLARNYADLPFRLKAKPQDGEACIRRTLDALRDFVTPRVQTLSYLGLSPEALSRFVLENGLTGVDRIVPVGHTMDFSLIWDGYDLIQTLSRKISAL